MISTQSPNFARLATNVKYLNGQNKYVTNKDVDSKNSRRGDQGKK